MDETAVYLDMLGERTLEETGTRTILVRSTGHDRDNVTVILGALGDRTKLASLMVFKGVWPQRMSLVELLLQCLGMSVIMKKSPKLWLERCWGRLLNALS